MEDACKVLWYMYSKLKYNNNFHSIQYVDVSGSFLTCFLSLFTNISEINKSV